MFVALLSTERRPFQYPHGYSSFSQGLLVLGAKLWLEMTVTTQGLEEEAVEGFESGGQGGENIRGDI